MQINPFYFRGPVLFFFALLLFLGRPSHSVISAGEQVVNADVLDDLVEQEAGASSQKMKEILDSFRVPSKPPTGEPGEKLVEGAAKSFSEATRKLGHAQTPMQSDPALLQKETADDGKVDMGYVEKEQDEVSLTDTTVSPQPSSDNKGGGAMKVAVEKKAESIPVVSTCTLFIIFDMHFLAMS